MILWMRASADDDISCSAVAAAPLVRRDQLHKPGERYKKDISRRTRSTFPFATFRGFLVATIAMTVLAVGTVSPNPATGQSQPTSREVLAIGDPCITGVTVTTEVNGPSPVGRCAPPRRWRVIDSAVWVFTLGCLLVVIAAFGLDARQRRSPTASEKE
ncbi:MAG: hypothetical protein N2037_07265 [Acidimicrobiales bacterium]|nr:hypothetical protein [Acidimicrobiales bacterium]